MPVRKYEGNDFDTNDISPLAARWEIILGGDPNSLIDFLQVINDELDGSLAPDPAAVN